MTVSWLESFCFPYQLIYFKSSPKFILAPPRSLQRRVLYRLTKQSLIAAQPAAEPNYQTIGSRAITWWYFMHLDRNRRLWGRSWFAKGAPDHGARAEAFVWQRICEPPTALSSPRLPHLAKCALRLALELPAATPHKALSTLEKPNNTTLGVFGKAGDRQSSTIALSLNISAESLYILHSGSSEVPSLCANRIVATLPILSCNTESKIAAVGDAEASPTPTPGRK